MKLSVIIPSYADPLLQKTIDSLLSQSALGDQLEVIAVLDGRWPKEPLRVDDRLKIVHLGTNRGMRGAINAGVLTSTGEFIMRTDEHCMFGDRYDAIMTSQCESNWIVTARRYFLDTVEWKVMDVPPVDCEKLVIQEGKKFSGQRWDERAKELENEPIIESMAMQGSMWLMRRSWWDKAVGLLQTDGYGPHYQDSHEMVFKTWQLGGKLMVNKNTWFAHKHRSFPRTHNEGSPENPTNREAGWQYSLETWGDYYQKEVRPKWRI